MTFGLSSNVSSNHTSAFTKLNPRSPLSTSHIVRDFKADAIPDNHSIVLAPLKAADNRQETWRATAVPDVNQHWRARAQIDTCRRTCVVWRCKSGLWPGLTFHRPSWPLHVTRGHVYGPDEYGWYYLYFAISTTRSNFSSVPQLCMRCDIRSECVGIDNSGVWHTSHTSSSAVCFLNPYPINNYRNLCNLYTNRYSTIFDVETVIVWRQNAPIFVGGTRLSGRSNM